MDWEIFSIALSTHIFLYAVFIAMWQIKRGIDEAGK